MVGIQKYTPSRKNTRRTRNKRKTRRKVNKTRRKINKTRSRKRYRAHIIKKGGAAYQGGEYRDINVHLVAGEPAGTAFTANIGGIETNTYPIIERVIGTSSMYQAGVRSGDILVGIGESPAPAEKGKAGFNMAKGLIKGMSTSAYSLTVRSYRFLDPDKNHTTAQMPNAGGVTYELGCPAEGSYVRDITKHTIGNIPERLWHTGENLGGSDDHFGLNPRQIGFEGIPGEVLFINEGYDIYKGASEDDPASEGVVCDYRLDYPQWFGDWNVANLYSGINNDVMVYRTKRPIVLLNLLDAVNIEWIMGKIKNGPWYEVGLGWTEDDRDEMAQMFFGLTHDTGSLSSDYIWDGKKADDSVSKKYVTLCGKKYGGRVDGLGRRAEPGNGSSYASPGMREGDDMNVLSRNSNWMFDVFIPEILTSALGDIPCDGYFADTTPAIKEPFPREIMIMKPGECLDINEENEYHTCKRQETEPPPVVDMDLSSPPVVDMDVSSDDYQSF